MYMKSVSVILFLIVSFVSMAENYFRPGTVWIDEVLRKKMDDRSHIYYGDRSLIFYFLCSEITVYGERVMPLKVFIDNGTLTTWGYIKTEGERVYVRDIDPYRPEWYLMYDFGLKINEETDIYVGNWFNFVADDADRYHIKCIGLGESQLDGSSDQLNNANNDIEHIKLEILHPGLGKFKTEGTWIKGIGTKRGVVRNDDPLPFDISFRLTEVISNGKTISKF